MDMDDWDVTRQPKYDASAAPRRNNHLREYTPVFRHTPVTKNVQQQTVGIMSSL